MDVYQVGSVSARTHPNYGQQARRTRREGFFLWCMRFVTGPSVHDSLLHRSCGSTPCAAGLGLITPLFPPSLTYPTVIVMDNVSTLWDGLLDWKQFSVSEKQALTTYWAEGFGPLPQLLLLSAPRPCSL